MSDDASSRTPDRSAPAPSLWRDRDFQKIFTARIAASFGSMLGGLGLAAILLLDARPGEMAVLTAVGTVPALLFGLSTGAWADRVKRRQLLVLADVSRAVVIASLPLAYFLFALHIEHLYAVAFLLGTLRTVKEVASPAYLPSVVGEDRLFEANSKITAGLAVVETTAFTVGGWIAQLSSAIISLIVQGAAYLVGGLSTLSIRKPEPEPEARSGSSHIGEIVAGFRFVRSHPILLIIIVSNTINGLSDGIIGGQITLFAISEVGFEAGVVGTLYALGGISALVGAVVATRLTQRFGLGNMMAIGWIIPGIVTFLYPLTPEPLLLAALFFAVPQLLGDGLWTVHDISEVTLRQAVTPEATRGRVNSLINVSHIGAQVVGAILGGVIAETLGLRMALAVGAALITLSGLVIYFSPVRKVRSAASGGRA